jgi:hypothetical protein
LGITGLSHAATIVSPALPTGTNTGGACYIRNVGTKSVSLQVTALNNFSPGFINPNVNTCNPTPLAAGRTCILLVNDLPDDVTFACSAVVKGSAKNLRGVAEVRAITVGGLKVIVAEDLR